MGKIVLKSKILQQMLGDNEVNNVEQLYNKLFNKMLEKYEINLSGLNISEEEMLDLLDDLKEISVEYSVDFFISNLPDELKEKFIIYYFKGIKKNRIYSIEIDEEDESEIIDKWSSTTPNVSQELAKKLKAKYKKDNITLQDIYTHNHIINFDSVNQYLEFVDLFPSIRYVNNKQCIYVSSIEDIEKLKQHELTKEHYPITLALWIKNMSVLSIMDLNMLSQPLNTGTISIPSEEEHNAECNGIPTRYNYTVEEYGKLRQAIDKILNSINPQLTEIEKFLKIYYQLGNSITYELDNDGEASNREEAHNLIGPLLEKSRSLRRNCFNYTTSFNMCGIRL